MGLHGTSRGGIEAFTSRGWLRSRVTGLATAFGLAFGAVAWFTARLAAGIVATAVAIRAGGQTQSAAFVKSDRANPASFQFQQALSVGVRHSPRRVNKLERLNFS
jgi:hypothetical protein